MPFYFIHRVFRKFLEFLGNFSDIGHAVLHERGADTFQACTRGKPINSTENSLY